MAEISRLSGSMLDAAGQAWSFNELAGFWSFPSRTGWLADFSGANGDRANEERAIFLAAYLAADLAFIFVYWTGIDRFLQRRFHGQALRTRCRLLLILVGADLVENGLALITVFLDRSTTALGFFSWVLAVVNTVKSLAFVAVAFMVIRGQLTRGRRTVRCSLKLIYQLVRQHRFSVVPLVLLALVSITPGAEILDQVPDITRRWTDGPRTFALEGGLAVIALLVFAGTLFMIGRMRTAVAARDWEHEVQLPDAPLLRWFAVPLVIFILGLVASVLGVPVGLVRLGLVCAIPIVVATYSCHLRKINKQQESLSLWSNRVNRGDAGGPLSLRSTVGPRGQMQPRRRDDGTARPIG
jgi:hypothetical protein